eukprot:SAG31_NODE_859_length_11432_cov_5.450631_8_plen_148_part_00
MYAACPGLNLYSAMRRSCCPRHGRAPCTHASQKITTSPFFVFTYVQMVVQLGPLINGCMATPSTERHRALRIVVPRSLGVRIRPLMLAYQSCSCGCSTVESQHLVVRRAPRFKFARMDRVAFFRHGSPSLYDRKASITGVFYVTASR